MKCDLINCNRKIDVDGHFSVNRGNELMMMMIIIIDDEMNGNGK